MHIELKYFNEINPHELAYFANDPRVSFYLRNTFPYPYTLDYALSFINQVMQKNAVEFAIVVDNVCIGCIGTTFHQDIYQYNAEIGYWIGYDYWGRGIMGLVVSMFTKYLFENFHIHKIFAEVFSENKASIHVLKKNNFKQEAFLKDHIYKNNQFYDCEIYSCIREDIS